MIRARPGVTRHMRHSPGGSAVVFNISVSMTATTGVEPFGISFNAINTTSPNTQYPFHDLYYKWDFGPGVTGTWTIGSQNNAKRIGYGPVAACVFPAGTHTVSLAVTDQGTTSTVTLSPILIESADAYSEWLTTKSVVISASGTFTGKPTGAAEVTSSDFDAVIAAQKTVNGGKVRLLFRDNETYSASVSSTMDGAGPWMIGRFGGGTAVPWIALAPGVVGIDVSGTDGRLTGFKIDGANDTTAIGIRFLSGQSQCTVDAVTIDRVSDGVVCSESNLVGSKIFFNNSTIGTMVGGNGHNGVYFAARDSGFMGVTITNCASIEHAFRTQFLQRSVISNCNFGPAGVGKGSVAIRGPNYAGTAIYPAGSLTQDVVIADSVFTPSATQVGCAEIQPQDNTKDERFQNVIFECNRIKAVTSTVNAGGLALTCALTSVRNNIIETFGNASDNRHITINNGQTTGQPAPDSIWIQNNALYSAQAGNNLFCVYSLCTQGAPTNVFIRNNIAFAPLKSSPLFNFNQGGTPMVPTLAANSSNAQITTTVSIGFASATPVNPADFAAANYAVNSGTSAAIIYDDYLRVLRTGTMDMGAVQP